MLWLSLALLVFWGVGVHNRLMRMRARGLDSFGAIEKHVRQYAELVQERGLAFDAGRGDVPHDSECDSTLAWKALVAGLRELEQALKEARSSALAAEPLRRLALANAALHGAWVLLRDTPVDLAGPIVPEAMQKQWELIAHGVDAACKEFDDLQSRYNEALAQFPASLLVGMMGFKPGGTL